MYCIKAGEKMFCQIVADLQRCFQCISWKNPHISVPAQFKPVLFKGQLYKNP